MRVAGFPQVATDPVDPVEVWGAFQTKRGSSAVPQTQGPSSPSSACRSAAKAAATLGSNIPSMCHAAICPTRTPTKP